MTPRVIALCLTVLAFVGCGGSKTNERGASATQAQSPPSSPALVVDLTISGGTVNPTNAEFKARLTN